MRRSKSFLYGQVVLLAVTLTLALGNNTFAASSNAFLFDGVLPDGTAIEVVYVPENAKLGLVTKNSNGEPTSAYLFYEVEDTSGKFYRTASDSFGKVDDELFVYFELSSLQGTTIDISVDSGQPVSLNGQEPVSVDSLRPFGSCRNYCYPSDPSHYNWYLCFWCCATTGRNPC